MSRMGLAPKKPIAISREGPDVDDDARLRALNALFRAGRAFWTNVGRVNPRACQFLITDAPHRDFYIVVDAHGARAARGRHAAADVQWRSDAEALDDGLRGQLRRDRVRLRGDVDALVSILRGVAQTVI